MYNKQIFKAEMVRKGYTQERMAAAMGLSNKAFNDKLANGKWWMSEIVQAINILDIKTPMRFINNLFFS